MTGKYNLDTSNFNIGYGGSTAKPSFQGFQWSQPTGLANQPIPFNIGFNGSPNNSFGIQSPEFSSAFNSLTGPDSWGMPSSSNSMWDSFNNWMGSDSAKNLGSILGPVASLGSAYMNYSSAQDALDEQKRQNAFLQDFAKTQLGNEVALAQGRAGDIEARRQFSRSDNTDAWSDADTAAAQAYGKEKQGLKTL